jgi:DNA repair protein RadC
VDAQDHDRVLLVVALSGVEPNRLGWWRGRGDDPVPDHPQAEPAEPAGSVPGALPSDRDLLAALVGFGVRTGSNGRAHAVVDRLLSRFGSVAEIGRAHPADLTYVDGVGQATAARIAAAFELPRRAAAENAPKRIASQDDVVNVVAPLLRGRTRERAVVVSCGRRGRVLGCDVICEGSADRALMPLREAVVAVLRRDGQAFAIAHNHPSGDPSPSADDIQATLRMSEAARVVGLGFLGHVVVTDTSWQSVPACGGRLLGTRR